MSWRLRAIDGVLLYIANNSDDPRSLARSPGNFWICIRRRMPFECDDFPVLSAVSAGGGERVEKARRRARGRIVERAT